MLEAHNELEFYVDLLNLMRSLIWSWNGFVRKKRERWRSRLVVVAKTCCRLRQLAFLRWFELFRWRTCALGISASHSKVLVRQTWTRWVDYQRHTRVYRDFVVESRRDSLSSTFCAWNKLKKDYMSRIKKDHWGMVFRQLLVRLRKLSAVAEKEKLLKALANRIRLKNCFCQWSRSFHSAMNVQERIELVRLRMQRNTLVRLFQLFTKSIFIISVFRRRSLLQRLMQHWVSYCRVRSRLVRVGCYLARRLSRNLKLSCIRSWMQWTNASIASSRYDCRLKMTVVACFREYYVVTRRAQALDTKATVFHARCCLSRMWNVWKSYHGDRTHVYLVCGHRVHEKCLLKRTWNTWAYHIHPRLSRKRAKRFSADQLWNRGMSKTVLSNWKEYVGQRKIIKLVFQQNQKKHAFSRLRKNLARIADNRQIENRNVSQIRARVTREYLQCFRELSHVYISAYQVKARIRVRITKRIFCALQKKCMHIFLNIILKYFHGWIAYVAIQAKTQWALTRLAKERIYRDKLKCVAEWHGLWRQNRLIKHQVIKRWIQYLGRCDTVVCCRALTLRLAKMMKRSIWVEWEQLIHHRSSVKRILSIWRKQCIKSLNHQTDPMETFLHFVSEADVQNCENTPPLVNTASSSDAEKLKLIQNKISSIRDKLSQFS